MNTPPNTPDHPDDRSDGHSGEADVIPLHPDTTDDQGGQHQDPAADAGQTAAPAALKPRQGAEEEGRRRPIVPEAWNADNWRTTASHLGGLWWYRTRYHALRCPWYTLAWTWFALRGGLNLVGRVIGWWQWTDGWMLESAAVAAGRAGHHDAMNVHREGKRTRTARGQLLAAALVAVLVAFWVLTAVLPWWAWWLAAMGGMWWLARFGAPDGQPLIRAAVVPAAYQTPTPEIINRAFASLGIKAINTVIAATGTLEFVSDVARDADGWGVELNLPHGVSATTIIKRQEDLASGLRRPRSATWPEGVPHEHPGRVYLWIGRRDLSKTKPVPYPLIKAGTTDVFATVPFATTPRGQLVGAPLFEYNWIIGAAPGQGKTNAMRVLASDVALDVVCDLWIHEHSGKGDLEPLAQVCHRYVSGLDDDAIAYSAESLALLRKELERREKIFKKLPKEVRPDGKLTRDLAVSRRDLRPIAVFFDEVQNLFLHPLLGAKAADDMAHVMRLARAYGIFIILATQRPDADCIPSKVSGLALVKCCLKVPDQPSNDMVLGTGAYKAGYRASEFRLDVDRGLAWYNGQREMQPVRTHYMDLGDTAKVAARARTLRGRAGVLSGYALGDDQPTPQDRSFAADVLTVFGQDRALWCETIAARLRDRLPEVYADITQDAVSSQLRGLGVEVKNVRESGKGPRKGCHRDAVQTVAADAQLIDA